jgi:hypothetical protein
LRIRHSIVDRPWVTLKQIHSNKIVRVKDTVNSDTVLTEGDALISNNLKCAIAVFAADCGNVGIVTDNGLIAAVHCGWRGLENKILQNTVKELLSMGASDIYAIVGPNIRKECYEFGEEDLKRLVSIYGNKAKAMTTKKTLSLDINYCIESILESLNVKITFKNNDCTKCSDEYFSFRKDKTSKRQALVLYFG